MSSTDCMVFKALLSFSQEPYMTIAVPVCKREHSSTIVRLIKKGCLNTTTESATEVVKEEVVLDIMDAAESSNLSSEVMAAQKTILQAMETACCVLTEEFQNLPEKYELLCGENLSESDDLLLCNPPYYVHCEYELHDRDHKEFSAKDIELFSDFVEYALWRGGRRRCFMFCHTVCLLVAAF